MQIYNSLGKEKQQFNPIDNKNVRMYVCGPTVYGPAHIGHAKTYAAFDIIRRYLEYRGYKVDYVVNITDVHDDMIKKANELGITIFELGEKNTKLFFEDMARLRVKPADNYPKVTEHIKEIIELIKILEEKGFAYETDDGVYFKVSNFKNYGKLSGIKVEEEITGTRVETDKYEKEQAMDFALWKKEKPGEPSWESPWGKGRPGWHIECSVFIWNHLGKQIDIHGGARDLIFPHHENEIAQAEAASGKNPFVKYWMHTGFLNVEGRKMSKSLGNFIIIPDLLKEYDPLAFRFFIALTHYRSPIDFSKSAMEKAKNTLVKINRMVSSLMEIAESENKEKKDSEDFVEELISNTKSKFIESMDDDFNTPNAWKYFFEFESNVNKLINEKKLNKALAEKLLNFIKEIDSIFQVFTFEIQKVKLTGEQKKLIGEREKFRSEKNWKEADRIRDILLEQGIQLLDTKEGVKAEKISI